MPAPIRLGGSYLWILHRQWRFFTVAEIIHEHDDEAADRDTTRLAELLDRYKFTPDEISPNFRLPSAHRIRARVLTASHDDAVPNEDDPGSDVIPAAAFIEHESKQFRNLDEATAWTDAARTAWLSLGWIEVSNEAG